VAAFYFTERTKDYGGIHLGVPRSSTGSLLALTDELDALPTGHSRNVRLLSVGDDLPGSITGRSGHRSLAVLRIGSADAVTRILIEKQAGVVALSQTGLSAFRTATASVHDTHGDILIAGDSGLPVDRLWFWPIP
jgi:hypothetical protein